MINHHHNQAKGFGNSNATLKKKHQSHYKVNFGEMNPGWF